MRSADSMAIVPLIVLISLWFYGCTAAKQSQVDTIKAYSWNKHEQGIEVTIPPASSEQPSSTESDRHPLLIADSNLGLQPMTGAISSIPIIHLRAIDQAVTTRSGIPYLLDISSLGEIDAAIITSTDPMTGTTTISATQQESAAIYITHKCQIVRVHGVKSIPQLRYAPGIPPEKTVITPLFDPTSNCRIVGYEVRYGTIERKNGSGGCLEEGLQTEQIYKACLKKLNR